MPGVFMGQEEEGREQTGSTKMRSQRHVGVRSFSHGQQLIRTLIKCERRSCGMILKPKSGMI